MPTLSLCSCVDRCSSVASCCRCRGASLQNSEIAQIVNVKPTLLDELEVERLDRCLDDKEVNVPIIDDSVDSNENGKIVPPSFHSERSTSQEDERMVRKLPNPKIERAQKPDEMLQSMRSMSLNAVAESYDMVQMLDSLNSSLPPIGPTSLSNLSSTSLNVTDEPSIESHLVYSGTQNSTKSLNMIESVSSSNGSTIAMSLHRARRQARLRSMRLRVPTVLGGTIFTLVALLMITIAEPYSIGDVVAAWLATFGVSVTTLGLLPSDRAALLGTVICIYVPIACLYGALIFMQVLDRKGKMGDDKCTYVHQDTVPCWYVVFVLVLRLVDSIPCVTMIARLVFAVGRRVRSVRLLSILWSCLGWLFIANGSTALIKSIAGCVVGQFLVAVSAFFMSVPYLFFGILHVFAPEFRFGVQSWFMSRGEAVVTAAGIAELLGGRNVQQVIASARTQFSCIRADRITKEDMADNLPNPTLAALIEKARLGFVDAFFSHSWHDSAEAKWKALQDYRYEFKVAQGREPRLWIDKYCIDQDAIDESLACLPVYLSGCRKLLIACGDTYLKRLWCLIEIFVFLEMGGRNADLDVRLLMQVRPGVMNLASEDDRPSWNERPSMTSLVEVLQTFDPRDARCFNSYDNERLHAVIETTGYDRINQVVDDVFLQQMQNLS